MTIEEYNEELGILRENLKACRQTKQNIILEQEILNSIKVYNGCEREALRLRTYVNEKSRLNSDMIDHLTWAMMHLKNNKEADQSYSLYLKMYKALAKQYIKIATDKDFLMLADKYIGDTSMFVK